MDNAFFMKKALEAAKRALAGGEFPVGCVVTYQGEIIAAGCRKNTKRNFTNEVDHAEMVALKRLAKLRQDTDTSKATIFCTMEPCLMCLGAIILSGIRQIVFAYEDVMGGGTTCDLTKLSPLYANSRISITRNVLREESLALLKAYFSDPANTYWQGSLLAGYTLSQ